MSSPQPAKPALTRLDLSSVRFLVVDDNLFMRRLIREVLLSLGAGIIDEAATADAALAAVATDTPDIILCDWMMHPVDGLSFLKALRRGPKGHIPVIMVTGHATTDHVAAALGDGADSYIVKPFGVNTLLDHIVRVVQDAAKPRAVAPAEDTKAFFL